MSEDATQQETKAQFAKRLEVAFREAMGTDALPNPDGWRLDRVELRATRGGDSRVEQYRDPTFVFSLPDRTIAIAVLQTDPSKSAFHRTPRYDIVYIAQEKSGDRSFYETNHDLISRFAAWVDSFDRGVPVEPIEPPAMTEPTPPPPPGDVNPPAATEPTLPEDGAAPPAAG
jgi:hypothetical protein